MKKNLILAVIVEQNYNSTILKTDNARAAQTGRSRDDSVKKGCYANANTNFNKRNNMESLAQGEHFESKEATSQEKGNNLVENKDGKTYSLESKFKEN